MSREVGWVTPLEAAQVLWLRGGLFSVSDTEDVE